MVACSVSLRFLYAIRLFHYIVAITALEKKPISLKEIKIEMIIHAFVKKKITFMQYVYFNFISHEEEKKPHECLPGGIHVGDNWFKRRTDALSIVYFTHLIIFPTACAQAIRELKQTIGRLETNN